jgi:hypothetical protein
MDSQALLKPSAAVKPAPGTRCSRCYRLADQGPCQACGPDFQRCFKCGELFESNRYGIHCPPCFAKLPAGMAV